MTEKNVDLRVLKTKLSIKKALFKLMKEKDFDRITVQDIADESMINRNTFYLHYLDKYDLLEKITEQHLLQFERSLEARVDITTSFTENDFKETLKSVFHNIEQNMEFYQIQLNSNGKLSFQLKLREILKKHVVKNIHKTYETTEFDPKTDIALEYMISGIVGVICIWIKSQGKFQFDETIDLLNEIHYKNLMNLLESFDKIKILN